MTADTDARIYEAGRRRGLSECPCGANPGAEDLLTYEDGVQAGIAECLKSRETRWFGVAMDAIDTSRRLVCEAEALLRWFRGQDGPIDQDRLSGAWTDYPSLRVAIGRLDSKTDPVALFESRLTGRDLTSRVRMTRRYRALRDAVKRTRAMQGRAWHTPGPDRVAPSPAEKSTRSTLGGEA